MISTRLTIINELGLHARTAAKLAQTASGFASDIRCGHSGRLVDAKSIMVVMLLAAPRGTVLHLEVEGADEQKAMAALKCLIDNGFGEQQ